MNKKLSLLLTAGTFALLSACGDSVVETDENPPINPNAKLTVLVRDGTTGEPLGGATVKLLSTGETITTNSANGAAIFASVYTGGHNVLVSKDDYASAVYDGDIGGAGQDGTFYIAKETTVSIELYPKTASLDGYLYYATKEDGEVYLPVSNAKVLLTYTGPGDDFLERTETADVTGGKFEFPKLAAVGINYTLLALPVSVTDGRTLEATTLSTEPLIPGVAAHITNKEVYGQDVSTFILVSNKSRVTPAEAVVFTFSDDINLDKIVKNAVSVSIANQAANFVWAGNTLTITPVGEWKGSSFNVTGLNGAKVESVKGKTTTFNLSGYPVTVVRNIDLSGVAITLAFVPNVGGDSLKWNNLGNVDLTKSSDHYDVYYKLSTEKEYAPYAAASLVGTGTSTSRCSTTPTPPCNETTATIAVPLAVSSLSGATGTVYNFIVRGRNSESQTVFSNAVNVTKP